MPRVLILSEFATLNGGERSLLALLEPLARQGFEFLVAGPEGPLTAAAAKRDIPFISLERLAPGDKLPPEEIRQQLADLISKTRPALVHANSLNMTRLCGPVAADLKVPSVGHIRDMYRLSAQAVQDVNRHTLLIAVSRAAADWHEAQGVEKEKLRVVHNGVDLEIFSPGQTTGYLHREFGLPPEAILAGGIGQIGMRKGWDILLEAAARLNYEELGNIHFLIAGSRYSQKQEAIEYEQELHRKSAARPLVGRVHFLGERTDIPDFLRELALLVHPARQEPLGRVLLEAAATGLAVAATDVGGTREIFPQEEALLVPAEDPSAISAAMQTIFTNPSLRQDLGIRARRRAEVAFNIPLAAAALKQCYQAALK